MAKDKKSKKADKAKNPAKSAKKGKKAKKVSNLAATVAVNAGKVAAGVVVEEIVAATLVAAAAAIRDPKKARAMAAAAGNELKALTNEAAKEGSALWRLALDIAGRSLEFVGTSGETATSAPAKPAKARAPRKRTAS